MNNQKGNTLISAMVAIVLMSITTLAFTRLAAMMAMQQHTMQVNSNALALTNNLMISGCTNPDGSVTFNGTTLANNMDMQEYGVTIVSISPTSIQYHSLTNILGGNTMKAQPIAVRACASAVLPTPPADSATTTPDNSAQSYCLQKDNHWIDGICIMHEPGDGCGR